MLSKGLIITNQSYCVVSIQLLCVLSDTVIQKSTTVVVFIEYFYVAWHEIEFGHPLYLLPFSLSLAQRPILR